MITGRLRPVFKLTESCNLSCKYCYQEGKLGSGRFMTTATLTKALNEVAAATEGTMHLLWFGGEPTLYGKDRFAKALELASEVFKGRQLYHGIQTNGSLIDKDWAQLLAQYNFAVTVSLDGPEALHNEQRPGKKNAAGNSINSYEAVVAGIQNLRDCGLQPRISAVLTPAAHPRAKELVSWYAEHGVQELDFVPSTRWNAATQSFEVEIDGSQFKTFIMEVFDQWLEIGNPNFKVRLLSELARKVAGLQPHYCKLEGCCSHFVGFGWNGDVYPCDEFSGLSDFRLGNIHENSLQDLMTSPKAISIFRKWAQIPEQCSSCKWLRLCRGGCAWERQLSGSLDNPTVMCEALKALFERMIAEIPGSEKRWLS